MGKYDHHMQNNKVRDNGVPYASFGLLWEEFGTEILSIDDAKEFDQEFVQIIDLTDNTGEKNTMSTCISDMNPRWDMKEQNSDLLFSNAVDFAKGILERHFESINSRHKAYDIVTKMIEQNSDNILVMKEMIPWKDAVKGTKILYVVFPSVRGGYIVQAVPTEENSMIPKKAFPKEWRGADVDTLFSLTSIKTFQFCHKSGHLCAVGELNDAIRLAYMALK